MVTFLNIIHVIACIFLILVVLLQAGKGGGMGIAFGGGGSQTVFGSSGAGNFLTKLTAATAIVFIGTSLLLAHYASQQDSKRLQVIAAKKAEKKAAEAEAAKKKAELDKQRNEAAEKAKAAGAGQATPVSSEPGQTTPGAGTETPADKSGAAAKETEASKPAAGEAPKKAVEKAKGGEGETPKPKAKKKASDEGAAEQPAKPAE